MELRERLDAAIEASRGDRIVSCVVFVNRDGRQIYRRGAGLTDREENRPMQADAVFRLASVTNCSRTPPDSPTGRILDPRAPQSGGAGLSGTADDVMAVLDSCLTGTLLRPETIRMALSNQIGDVPRGPGEGFGFIGAVSTDPVAARAPWPAGTVAWGGGWGHNWFIDPVNRLSVVTCTNTMFEGLGGKIRFDVIEAVYAGGQG